MNEVLSNPESQEHGIPERFKGYPENVQEVVNYISTSIQVAKRTMQGATGPHVGTERYMAILNNASGHEGNAQAAAYALDCLLPLPQGENWFGAVHGAIQDSATQQQELSGNLPS